MSVTVPLNNYIVDSVAVPNAVPTPDPTVVEPIPVLAETPVTTATIPDVAMTVATADAVGAVTEVSEQPAVQQVTPLGTVNTAYAESLYKPYNDAIAAAETVDSIKSWLPQVYSPEVTQYLLTVIEPLGADINSVRQVIGDTIIETFFNHRFDPQVTPWSLTVGLPEEGDKLFGSPQAGALAKLPVIVAVGPTHYVHELDQDTTYGILLGLQNNPGINLYVGGLEVTEEMLAPFYAVPPQTMQTKPYSAVFYNGRKQFDSMDVITGYITSSEWLGLNPRVAMRDMRQLNIDADGVATFTPLAF